MGSPKLNDLLGLLRIRIKRGVNLAVCDINTSDPYVVVKMGKQRLKTRVIRKDINPEWNEDLTLSISNLRDPIYLTVYDHDTFTKDDEMGNATIDVQPLLHTLRTMNVVRLPNCTIVTKIQPGRSNCLAEQSDIVWKDGRVVQDMCLRLKNVECGEIDLQLQWIDIPGSKGIYY